MKRRNFIKSTGAALSLPLLLNGLRLSAMTRPALFDGMDEENDRILVLVQLNGGCDGLNTVIPLDQYSGLAQARSNLLIPENQVLKIDDKVGLHPALSGMQHLFLDGKLSVLQSVGYPNQNRSHFRSKDIWVSGSPAEEFWSTGWIGRYFYDKYPDFPDNYPNAGQPHPFAITLGNIVSETCQGPVSNFSLTLTDPFSLSPLLESEGGTLPNTPYGEELNFLRISIKQTNAYSEVVSAAAERAANTVDYPENNDLANQLRTVALLIAGGLKTKVYVVNLGGFDTHANQVNNGDTTSGEHANLLNLLSEATAAFQADLQGLGIEQRVIGLTFTEFGRRIRSNASFGTDHGTAAPLLVFGSCVKSQILGENPEISGDVDPAEGLPMQFDFRDVYGSILMDWFAVAKEKVQELLYPDFQYLPIVTLCAQTTEVDKPELPQPILTFNYPNPFHDWTTLSFSCQSEWVKISIFDNLGSELQTLVNQRLPAGEHQMPFDGSRLPAGAYFYRLQMEGRQKTVRMVKM